MKFLFFSPSVNNKYISLVHIKKYKSNKQTNHEWVSVQEQFHSTLMMKLNAPVKLSGLFLLLIQKLSSEWRRKLPDNTEMFIFDASD